MRYQQYRTEMKTGDVIAFSGKGQFSDLIKWKTKSNISHVGMVLDTNMSMGIGRSVMLIESTTLINSPDAVTKSMRKGVQMQWLSSRLHSYDGEAYWHPLLDPIPREKRLVMQHWLRSTHKNQIPYDTVQAMGAGMDFFDSLGFANETDLSKLFCSELVTKALQIAGVIDGGINPSEQTPADVLKFPCFTRGGDKIL